jgi:signal transduction histidine kinase/CheY-like chemotaxis protein
LQRDGRFEIVGEASNGVEAISLATDTRPDAVVLDLSMPVMDGLQALPEIRKLLPRGKIVVLSGFNASQMEREALALGADAYVEKGTAFGRLVTMLLDLVAREAPETPETGDRMPAVETAAASRDPDELARQAVSAATGSSNLDAAFEQFCRVAAGGIRFDRASFWVVGDGGVCECAAVADSKNDRLTVGTKLTLAGRARRVLQGHPFVEPDTATEAGDVTNSVLNANGIRSSLVLPLVIGGETKALVCFSSGRPHTFSHEDVPLAKTLVGEVASTFHLLYLLERERAAGSLLKEAGERNSDIVGMVAHDLRSPMSVISGYAQYMRDSWTTLDEVQKLEFLDAISRNVDSLAQLVEDMLEVASIESGQLSCDMQPFDLVELVRATVAELAVANTGRTCTMTLPATIPTVVGDVRRQRQIVANLISNALKFSPPSKPIDVIVAVDENSAAVSVRDDGPGIEPEHLTRIFEKFYRVTGNGQKAPGYGLGLYICRLLVEAQGGRIWVESVPGAGSRFTYTVRVNENSASIRPGAASAAA